MIVTIPRRSILTGLAASFAASALPVPAGADAWPQPTLRDISNWLEDVETLQSSFQQYNDDGTVNRGTLYIRRPGRFRMEYDDQDALILVSASAIAIWDGKGGSDPVTYPLRTTPLWHLLRKDVDLGRPGAIKSFETGRGLTRITAYDDAHPEAGRIVLEFDNADGTIKLDGWKTRSAEGWRTTIRLRETEYGIPLPNSLFSIDEETRRRSEDQQR